MKVLLLPLLAANALAAGAPLHRPVLSSARPAPDTARVLALRGGARRGKSVELPWWASHNNEASGLFNNLRIPAALVAGAVISATFVLEPSPTDAGPIVLTKKMHLFLGIVSLCCECAAAVPSPPMPISAAHRRSSRLVIVPTHLLRVRGSERPPK
jgi:hypothetical protein